MKIGNFFFQNVIYARKTHRLRKQGISSLEMWYIRAGATVHENRESLYWKCDKRTCEMMFMKIGNHWPQNEICAHVNRNA